MKVNVHGFTPSEIFDLYKYLCIYEEKLNQIRQQNLFEERFTHHEKLKGLFATIVCNKSTKESLKTIGLVPMPNLVSMTWCRNSKMLSFLRHLRNSIAHGQIKKEEGYVELIDYNEVESGKVFSARGKIKSEKLFEIIHLINNNTLLS